MSISKLMRVAVPVLALALVVATLVTIFTGGGQRTLVAQFPRTVALHVGNDVRILGVAVGKVDRIEPAGDVVEVTLHYSDDVKVPEGAKAVIVSPSVVGDRYVQLTPAWESGPVLADGARLETDRTAVPLELDQIYASLDRLSVALGPKGANKDGALSDLLDVSAKNLDGQGAAMKQTITDLARLTGTLDNNSEEFFGSARKLESFVSTLAENDQTVRDFNASLGDVSGVLAGEREELSQALANLSTAMQQVNGFVADNREMLGRNIKGLDRVSKVLVKQRDALDEVLRVGPLALNNLAMTYNPQAGTLDTRANLGELVNQIKSDPVTLICGMVNQVDTGGKLCDLIQSGLKRPGASGRRSPLPSDPTLGGLVGGGQR